MDEDKLIIQQVSEERSQGHQTRVRLYEELESKLRVPVVSFFTSFKYPVMIEDNDADMLEGVLQKCDLSKGFALMLSSPGGSGLAAERIINVCRAYSGNQKYIAIVPGKAKSAATMICFGAAKIIMGKTSELGPLDPQVIIQMGDEPTWFSVYNIVSSYKDLFQKAVRTKGNLQPYLQQLANYDEREIAEFKSQLSLSEDIAIKALKTGMLSRLPDEQIRRKIAVFLTPERAKVHGRPIYAKDAADCKLKVETKAVDDSLWLKVYELYVRLNDLVSKDDVAKCVECSGFSFRAKVSGVKEGGEK